MTTRRLLWVAIRRWYVLLLGLAITAGGCWLVRAHAPVVYWSRTVVTVLQPGDNPLHDDEGSSLVGLASALVIRANGGPTETKTSSSSETTLYGEGIESGSRIRLRDVGSQWTSSIPDPVIYLEAVSPSRDVVFKEINGTVDSLRADLAAVQDDLGVARDSRAFLQIAPEQPAVVQVGGDRTRAMAGTVAAGLVLTGLALYFVDRRWPVPERVWRKARENTPGR